ncbi:hypothetical protein KDX01_21520 [Burkholderia vietnamiensis]|nr:hypothetical protein [Burkholderia vietnamiensis]
MVGIGGLDVCRGALRRADVVASKATHTRTGCMLYRSPSRGLVQNRTTIAQHNKPNIRNKYMPRLDASRLDSRTAIIRMMNAGNIKYSLKGL